MDNKKEIFGIMNQLKNLFCYNSEILLYNEKIQDKVNQLMSELGTITGTFDDEIKKETSNIKKELTIIDKETGERRELINVESMEHRVKNINNKNNIHSCLKTLALSNKIAHIYDGDIKSCQQTFINIYNEIFPDKTINNINFMESLSIKFPNLIGRNKYNLNSLSDNDFKKMWELISNSKSNNKGAKINVLKVLNVAFDIRNDEDINLKFIELCQNKEYIGSSYLIKKFKQGQDLVKFTNGMFAIKDSYISMIGQLLCNNQFKNTPYELVKTTGTTSGFDYMLIIDDKDLSYYIEVHMPNFIAIELMNTYGMKFTEERSFKRLGASAVYYRDKDEVKEIFYSQKEGKISESPRAQIITRDFVEGVSSKKEQNEEGKLIEENSEKNLDNNLKNGYEFITGQIIDKQSLFEEFLSDDILFKDFIEETKLSRFNENVPIEETNIINMEKYNYIYDNLNFDYKEKFINYSFNKLSNGDSFDKAIFNKLNENVCYDNIDNISKLLINLNDFKYDFVKNNNEIIKYVNIINEYKNYDNKYYDNKLIIDNYIDNYIDDKLNDYNIINKKNKGRWK